MLRFFARLDAVEQHTHVQHIICLQIARRANFVALPLFSVLLLLEIEEPEWKQSNPWSAEKRITVAAHLSQNFVHSTDTGGTLLYTGSSPLLLTLIAGVFPCYSKMTTGLFADTHGVTRYEHKLTHSQFVVACAEKIAGGGHKLVMNRFRQSIPREVHVTSQRKQTLTIFGTYWQTNTVY